MRICYIPAFNLPWCATSWRRALEFGREVAKCHEVTFLCPEQAVSKLEEETKNVSVDIIPVKFLSEGYISKGLARALAIKKFDIVHTFKPMPDIFPAGFAAKFKGCRWVADLDDLEGSKGFNRNSVVWKKMMMDFFEWLVPKFADHVTVASKGLEEFFAHRGTHIKIGEDCMLAKRTIIMTRNHIFDDPNVRIVKQGVKDKDVEIGCDVWTGLDTKILPGVKIGDGCVIGTSAVVTKDLEPMSIAVGIPAKVIKKRGEYFF